MSQSLLPWIEDVGLLLDCLMEDGRGECLLQELVAGYQGSGPRCGVSSGDSTYILLCGGLTGIPSEGLTENSGGRLTPIRELE